MSRDEGRRQIVVGVEKNNIFAGAGCKAAAERSRLPGVGFFADDLRLGPARGDGVEHVPAFVCRRVVDDHAFDMRIVLRLHGSESAVEETATVVIRDDDADERKLQWLTAEFGHGGYSHVWGRHSMDRSPNRPPPRKASCSEAVSRRHHQRQSRSPRKVKICAPVRRPSVRHNSAAGFSQGRGAKRADWALRRRDVCRAQ